VLALGRGYPSTWRRSDPPPSGVEASAFGASLITPIGIHEASLRAAKYAVLIIGLTFAAYFLFELFSAVRLHTLQYLLIGAANCVFFLLLLALAEHVGFAPAYAVSAVASTALISTYSAAVLGALRRALPIALLLGSTYGYLYVTLQAEDYALLFGALGLFTALAAFMYLTRRIDWHAVSFAAVNEMDPGAQLRA
jgi:inner membrane protein